MCPSPSLPSSSTCARLAGSNRRRLGLGKNLMLSTRGFCPLGRDTVLAEMKHCRCADMSALSGFGHAQASVAASTTSSKRPPSLDEACRRRAAACMRRRPLATPEACRPERYCTQHAAPYPLVPDFQAVSCQQHGFSQPTRCRLAYGMASFCINCKNNHKESSWRHGSEWGAGRDATAGARVRAGAGARDCACHC